MISLKILANLLDYPTPELWGAKNELLTEVQHCPELSEADKNQLHQFIKRYFGYSLIDAQDLYSSTFDVGRSVSLLLFEHIHGESRERGQAIVDLLNHYHKANLDLTGNELPDHLPVFLEYLSTQSPEITSEWLTSVAPIIKLLELRLQHRESVYSSLMTLLFSLSKTSLNEAPLRQQVANEKPDYTLNTIDDFWQEEQIKFMNNTEKCDVVQHTSLTSTPAPEYIQIKQTTRRNS